MPKVLILTETIGGSGHLKAARSIQSALKQKCSSIDIKLINGLSTVSRRLERAIRSGYMTTLRFAPQLWGQAYEREDRWSRLFQTPLGRWLASHLREVVMTENPDIVVCTHSFCLSALAQLKREQAFRLGAVITDFEVNRFWLHDEVDFYLVAHHSMGDAIKKEGYTRADIVATGIPIDPLFAELISYPKPKVRERLNGGRYRRTVLVMGGSLGLGPIDRMIGRLVDAFGDTVRIIVCTGKNSALRKKCETLYGEFYFIRILGYVDDLANYIAASDLIVTKPGGLTSSEALAMGVPILIAQPIPGHEERNSRFLLQQRVALRVTNPADISRYVRPFIEDLRFYEQFTERAHKTGRPAAARHAAEVILNA